MDVFVTAASLGAVEADVACVTVDGTTPDGLGYNARTLAKDFDAADVITPAPFPLPLGHCRVIETDGILPFDHLALLSVLVHVGQVRPGYAWSALADALDYFAAAGVRRVACPLLTCGHRIGADRALVGMIGEAEGRRDGELIICVPPHRWASTSEYARSLGVEERPQTTT